MYVFHRRLFLLHQNWRRGVLLPDSLYTPSRIWSQTSELSAVLGRARLSFLLPKLQRILHFDILKQSLPIRRSKQISASKSCTELQLLSLHSNRGSDISLYLAAEQGSHPHLGSVVHLVATVPMVRGRRVCISRWEL